MYVLKVNSNDTAATKPYRGPFRTQQNIYGEAF